MHVHIYMVCMYVCDTYIRQPHWGRQAAEKDCQSRVTVEVCCYKSPVRPSDDSLLSPWYLFTSTWYLAPIW